VLGHESLGRAVQAPAGGGLEPGDLVVGIVRQPDPVPCESCAAGEWDMCRNGRYTEHGIKELEGFMRQRYRIHPDYAVKVDPSLARTGVLLEPTSVVAKAWEQIDRIASRTVWRPRVALVTGAGPIGLLAALLGVQRSLEVHVLDRVTTGPSPSSSPISGPLTAPERSSTPCDADSMYGPATSTRDAFENAYLAPSKGSQVRAAIDRKRVLGHEAAR
jgi:glucose 1-dehydrogenase